MLLKLSLGLFCAATFSFSALAANVTVRNEHVSFDTNRVIDNLTIKRGGSVDLIGTTVRGNIFLEDESELYTEGAKIAGFIESDFSRVILLGNTKVDGSIKSWDSEIFVDDSVVKRDIRARFTYVDLCCGALIRGALLVNEGQLFLEETEVEGQTQIDSTRQVEVLESFLHGNAWLTEITGRIIIEQSFFRHDLRIEDNFLNRIRVVDNDVGGNVRLVLNTVDNNFRFEDNIIDGNLRSKNNDPDPELDTNVVGGDIIEE